MSALSIVPPRRPSKGERVIDWLTDSPVELVALAGYVASDVMDGRGVRSIAGGLARDLLDSLTRSVGLVVITTGQRHEIERNAFEIGRDSQRLGPVTGGRR